MGPGMAATEFVTKMDKGLVKSFVQILGGLFIQPAAKGAYSSLYAATQPNLPGMPCPASDSRDVTC